MNDNLQELREYLADPIIEGECGSLENFVQNVIDWSEEVERLAIQVRCDLKNANETGEVGPTTKMTMSDFSLKPEQAKAAREKLEESFLASNSIYERLAQNKV